MTDAALDPPDGAGGALAVHDLAVGHRGLRLLERISFAVSRRGRLAFVGPSGIGKTSVLRALALLDDPLDGTVRLGHETPETLGVPRWRRRVQWVPQRAVFFGGTVAEELARPFRFRVSSERFDRPRAAMLLQSLGLRAVLERPCGELSEGERQRVALARAVLVTPSVFLLDEPTSALDPEGCERVETVLANSSAILVVVSHDADQRERLGCEEFELRPFAKA